VGKDGKSESGKKSAEEEAAARAIAQQKISNLGGLEYLSVPKSNRMCFDECIRSFTVIVRSWFRIGMFAVYFAQLLLKRAAEVRFLVFFCRLMC